MPKNSENVQVKQGERLLVSMNKEDFIFSKSLREIRGVSRKEMAVSLSAEFKQRIVAPAVDGSTPFYLTLSLIKQNWPLKRFLKETRKTPAICGRLSRRLILEHP